MDERFDSDGLRTVVLERAAYSELAQADANILRVVARDMQGEFTVDLAASRLVVARSRWSMGLSGDGIVQQGRFLRDATGCVSFLFHQPGCPGFGSNFRLR